MVSSRDTPAASSNLSRLLSDLQLFLPVDLAARLASPTSRDLTEAIQALDSLEHNLTTYLPRPLVQANPVPGQAKGEMLEGTVLFADVTGFTPLTERLRELGDEGAEKLNRMINELFAALLDPLTHSRGELLIFAGDAVQAYFPALPEAEDAAWATRAGLRMVRAIAPFDSGPTPLSMSVGLARGRFFAAQVGNPTRMEYVVTGGPIQQAMIAEGIAEPRQVSLAPGMNDLLADQFRLLPADQGHKIVVDDLGEELGDYELRAPTRRRRSRIVLEWEPGALTELLAETLDEVKGLIPFFPPDVLDRIIAYQQERRFPGEHRPVTVLFVNLRGFEALIERVGPEHISWLVNWTHRYFVRANELIAGYGGLISHIDPYVRGFTLLCPFGAPLAQEETSHRAVAAALHLNLRLNEINAQLKEELGAMGVRLPNQPDAADSVGPLTHHIGITYGPIFTGQVGWQERREFVVVGDDVNLSARLMSKSQANQILISGWVYERVRQAFDCRPLEPMVLKGKSKPVSVYAVERRTPPSEWLVQAAVGTLVGREKEIQILEDALDAALSGRGRVVTLVGDTGIGKTRLIAEIARRARNWGLTLLAGRCLSYTQIVPYTPWVEMLWRWFGLNKVVGEDKRQEQRSRVCRVLEELGLRQEIESVTELLGLSLLLCELDATFFPEPAESTQAPRPQVALVNLVKRLAASQPALLIIDDLHWADQGSLQALIALARQVLSADEPLLLLVAARPDPIESVWSEAIGADLAGPARCRRLPLAGLSKAEVGKLTARLFRATDAAPELVDWLYERSGGNPLFTTQLVYALAGVEGLQVDPVTRQVRLSQDTPPLPASIREILLSRVDQLPETTRTVLKQAAVIGDGFSFEVLLNLSQLDEGQLRQHLDRLVAGNFVVPGDTFAFVHALLREAVYASLPYARRRLWHRKIADSMASVPAEAMGEQLDTVAFHYRHSDRPSQGMPYYQLAGDRALARRDWDRARSYYQAIVEAAEDEPGLARQRHVASQAVGDMYVLSGQPAQALAAYEAAQNGPSDWRQLEARLAILLARERPDEAKGRLLQTWQRLEEDAWRPWVAGALAWLSQAEKPDQVALAEAWWQRGLEASASDKAQVALEGVRAGHFLPDFIFWLRLALYDIYQQNIEGNKP